MRTLWRALCLLGLIGMMGFVGAMECNTISLLPGFTGSMISIAFVALGGKLGGLMYD